MTVRALLAPNPGPFTLDGTRTYLIGDDTVIDPGPAIEGHLASIRAGSPGLKRILLTHGHDDHAGAALILREQTGAEIFAPAGSVTDPDRTLVDGDRVDAGEHRLEVIATPGHTGEHVCFLSDEGELFTGDTILGQGTTVIFPPDGDMGDYLRSLERLRDRRPIRIYPGHGPVRHDAVALIEEYLYHRRMREEEILGALGGGLETIPEMRERIYASLDPRLREAAELQIQAHLDLLTKTGRVREREGRFSLAP